MGILVGFVDSLLRKKHAQTPELILEILEALRQHQLAYQPEKTAHVGVCCDHIKKYLDEKVFGKGKEAYTPYLSQGFEIKLNSLYYLPRPKEVVSSQPESNE